MAAILRIFTQNIVRSSSRLSLALIPRYRNATEVLLKTSCRRFSFRAAEWSAVKSRANQTVRWSTIRAAVGLFGCLCGSIAFCYASGENNQEYYMHPCTMLLKWFLYRLEVTVYSFICETSAIDSLMKGKWLLFCTNIVTVTVTALVTVLYVIFPIQVESIWGGIR